FTALFFWICNVRGYCQGLDRAMPFHKLALWRQRSFLDACHSPKTIPHPLPLHRQSMLAERSASLLPGAL
ncbi:hypothetical protein, partial [Thermogutta sp.]|uniref:hypothetical protein n=1 Tax=Thermogutta sp. TaxID=1962930 RepID=UPI003C7BF26F